MKLKVNTQILFAFILLTALAMSSCTPHKEYGLWGHQDATGTTTDTFWSASGHTFLVIPTATAIIVDQKGNQVSQAGVTISTTFGGGNLLKTQTVSTGSASIQILGLTYPVSVTASDGGEHEFSTVTIQSPPLLSPIKIVESPATKTVTK